MAKLKTFYNQFVGIAACLALLIGIIGFYKEDASARSKSQCEIDALKQSAPGIEARLDKLDAGQASQLKALEDLSQSVQRLQDTIYNFKR